ncbi:hypothetical protein [Clostridium sp. YIM B02551]|uniref:DUF6933 domain-containing protein n=1 Tax=Clostridium sp. YIM B02551 TaxID=2910679 RepID=UPI001EEA8325|nr:hypothetical protein [Clostridium sp. YIM B02551]
MIIECTKKLTDAMKMKVEAYEDGNTKSFFEWHANMFMFDRKKGVILMNNKTRYCIILYGLKTEHFKKFNVIILNAIRETFIAEGFSLEIVDKYITDCGEVHYTKTHDRSILSQITEFYFSISWQIEYYLPSEVLNLVELNQWVGSSLMCGTLGYANPIDLLKQEMKCEYNV